MKTLLIALGSTAAAATLVTPAHAYYLREWLGKKSYRSPGPLGIAATFVPSSNDHAHNAGPSRMQVVFSPTATVNP